MHTSLLVTGFPYNVDKNPYDCVGTFVKIVLNGIPIRRLGSAALDLAYVACGRFDGFWEADLHPWDVAAGVLIVKEAGGKVTKYNGKEFSIFDNTVLATNAIVHQQIMEVINQ
jgi:myo-inositol-1(or 4)-monophosphatase